MFTKQRKLHHLLCAVGQVGCLVEVTPGCVGLYGNPRDLCLRDPPGQEADTCSKPALVSLISCPDDSTPQNVSSKWGLLSACLTASPGWDWHVCLWSEWINQPGCVGPRIPTRSGEESQALPEVTELLGRWQRSCGPNITRTPLTLCLF